MEHKIENKERSWIMGPLQHLSHNNSQAFIYPSWRKEDSFLGKLRRGPNVSYIWTLLSKKLSVCLITLKWSLPIEKLIFSPLSPRKAPTIFVDLLKKYAWYTKDYKKIKQNV